MDARPNTFWTSPQRQKLQREAFASETQSVTECVEADGTSIGRFFVKRTNHTFAEDIAALEEKEGRSYAAYPVHIRLLGLRERGGRLILRFL